MFQIGLFSNLWVMGGVACMLALKVLYTYAPVMNQLFHSAPIGWESWGLISAVSIAAYILVGFEKWIRRWKSSNVVQLT